MGSVANYSASLSLVQTLNINKKEPNSNEEIQEFIKNNSNILACETTDNFNMYNNELISVNINDEDDDFIKTIDIDKLNLNESITLGKFLKDKIYKLNEKLFESEYCDADPVYWTFNVKLTEDQIVEKLKHIDLTILSKHISKFNINNPSIIKIDSKELLSCDNYIYCDSDNLSSDEFIITQNFIDSLKPGDKLVLDGEGAGEHC